MRVTFWGTRGSVPTPGPSTVRYGGNTSCVEVATSTGTCFILDSGTGIRELGLRLARQEQPVSAHLLLGHTHWDHISGFPFFAPGYEPGNRLAIYGAQDPERSLQDVLAGQMHSSYFPVPLADLRADLTFCELGEGKLLIHDATVQTHYLNHTCVCLGYRIDADGASVAYVTDHEPYAPSGNGMTAADLRLVDFVQGVDLLIQDAQYTSGEYATRRGWGHGSSDYVVDIAVAAGARRVALFHHEPTHADADIDRIAAAGRERAGGVGSAVEVFGAVEGAQLDL
jgi:phosphoribosyl 1,2-cyclic phosphodiesterase